jgi:hypothetical protein
MVCACALWAFGVYVSLTKADAGAVHLRHNSSRGKARTRAAAIDTPTVRHAKLPSRIRQLRLVARDPADVSSVEAAQEDNGGEAAHSDAWHAVEDRPNRGGAPDIVSFAVLCRDFFGADFRTGVFGLDIVMELQWFDPRAASLAINHTKIMSGSIAAKRIWMPDVTITNRAANGIDVISTQVVVDSEGTVTKVQRLLVRIKNRFELRSYPFDTQRMNVRLASEAYMATDVKLQPLNNGSSSGVTTSHVFDGSEWMLEGATVRTFEDDLTQSPLGKSRGELTMLVHRRSQPYFTTLLGPEAILVAFSWTVFLYPMLPSFSMPKVATSMISFMTLMALTLKSNNHLPVRGEESWLDVYEETCTVLVWAASWFNIILEVSFHEFKLPDVAKTKQAELAVAYPCLALISLGLLYCIQFHSHDVELFSIEVLLLRLVLYIATLGYLITMVVTLYKTYRVKGEQTEKGPEWN